MGSCTLNTIPADCPLLVAVLSQNCDTGHDDAHGALGLRGRGQPTPSGTLSRARGHSTPSGTGIRSPDARTVPVRHGAHPAAWNVPDQGLRRRPAAATRDGDRRQCQRPHRRCTSAPIPQARTDAAHPQHRRMPAPPRPLSPPSRRPPCSTSSWRWSSWRQPSWWWPSSSWPSWRWSSWWCASWPGPWHACPPAARRPARR